jgi:uncharacterized protein (DUF58 family)
MRKRLGLILVTMLLAAAVAVSGSVLVLRLFYTWALVLGAGYLWVALTSRGLSVAAAPLPERGRAGVPIRQEVTVTGTGRLPRQGLRVKAVNDLPGGEVSTTLDLPAGQSAKWQLEYPVRRRGRYHLGRFSLTAADPFGLFRKETVTGHESAVLIHPLTVPLPPFTMLGLTGSGLSKRMPEALSSSASTIREYTTGDSLRHIHWKSTAHTGRYMVKVFDADRSRHRAENYWIILDMATGAHSGEGDDSTVEYAVTLAASLAREYVSKGFRCGLIIGRGEPAMLAAASGQDQLTQIMDFLAVVEPGGSFSFPELIARNQNSFGSDSTVIIITPSQSSQLTETYHQLTARGCAAAYFLIDGADFGGSSPASVSRTLTQLGAPVYLLRRGETFQQALEQAAGAASWFSGASRS